jgi:hypothetical protein
MIVTNGLYHIGQTELIAEIEGENPALRKAFDKIQHSKTEIQPKTDL